MQSIFTKIDNFNYTFLGFNPLGALKNIRMWRKYILILTLASAFSWVVLGWESTWNQMGTILESIPSLITGQTSFVALQSQVASGYGIGQHLSTAVIYGFCFLLLSIHLEKQRITGSMNFFFTTALSLFSIGIYEVIYNILYSNLQNQPWTFTFASKQGLNLTVFVFFVVIGTISLVYLYSFKFKPNFSHITLILLLASTVTYALWIFYPFQLTQLTVQTSAGTWASTNLFPQTMYAVNLDPAAGASVAIGTPYYVPNNLLHFINIINKTFVSLAVLSFVMVRRDDA